MNHADRIAECYVTAAAYRDQIKKLYADLHDDQHIVRLHQQLTGNNDGAPANYVARMARTERQIREFQAAEYTERATMDRLAAELADDMASFAEARVNTPARRSWFARLFPRFA